MKYFKFELLLDDTEESEKQWDENDKKYSKYFDSIKHMLSDSFLTCYLNNYGFHDFNIVSFRLIEPQILIIELKKEKSEVLIKYTGVTCFKINADNYNVDLDRTTSMFYEWGYDELLCCENEFIHNILTSSGVEIIVSFKSIEIGDCKHRGR